MKREPMYKSHIDIRFIDIGHGENKTVVSTPAETQGKIK